MTIKNFAEWKEAIKREYDKFADMYPYLNDDGMDVYSALSEINFLMDFCDTTKEMLETFETIKFAKNTIYYNALRLLAKKEG